MFLKICSRDEDSQEFHEGIYECKTVRVTQKPDGYIFALERNGQDDDFVAVNGEKERHVYIMSGEGKTIERYPWMVKANK